MNRNQKKMGSKMTLDLKDKTESEILELRGQLDAELKRRQNEKKAKARREIMAIAKEAGMPITEIVNVAAPKYRNPANHAEGWTGKGRKPGLVEAALASGKTLDDLKA
ncbi:MAG: H-NS histone family protein [Burkholderia sp.]